MDWRSTSLADRAWECGDGVQWPKLRNPIFFTISLNLQSVGIIPGCDNLAMRADLRWERCTADDAEILGRLNLQLAEDEGAVLLGGADVYAGRMRGWLEQGRYDAALARADGQPVAYLLWRDDPDYGDVFVRQFFVARERRGGGIGRALFEQAVEGLWPGRPLRLDVYDSNPGGCAFWERLGFTPYSRLMRRVPDREGLLGEPRDGLPEQRLT
jgi:GNAT superfamily N-acetyltransferase